MRTRITAFRKSRRRAVTKRGIAIPPASIRLGGHNFAGDDDFLASAVAEANRLKQDFEAGSGSRILEIGCGVGRLPIGLAAAGINPDQYTGVDIDLGSIGWCRRNVRLESAEFIHLDLGNARYNPTGKSIDESFRLPFPDQSFDIVYLYSVFSHMELDEIQTYLGEFQRVLSGGGGVFLTAFLEDEVEDFAVNPPDYGEFPGEWEGELHCVRINRGLFADMVRKNGLTIARFDHGRETDGQSGVYLTLDEQAAR